MMHAKVKVSMIRRQPGVPEVEIVTRMDSWTASGPEDLMARIAQAMADYSGANFDEIQFSISRPQHR